MHNGGIKARARTGAHLEAPQITSTRVKSFDLQREASNSPGREHRYRNYLRKSKARRERVKGEKESGKRTASTGKRMLTRSLTRTTPYRVLRRRGMSLENARAADCGGGLSRLAKSPAHGNPAVGGAKSIPREHVLHPFQLRRRHGGSNEEAGVADRRREDDPGWARTATGFA